MFFTEGKRQWRDEERTCCKGFCTGSQSQTVAKDKPGSAQPLLALQFRVGDYSLYATRGLSVLSLVFFCFGNLSRKQNAALHALTGGLFPLKTTFTQQVRGLQPPAGCIFCAIEIEQQTGARSA